MFDIVINSVCVCVSHLCLKSFKIWCLFAMCVWNRLKASCVLKDVCLKSLRNLVFCKNAFELANRLLCVLTIVMELVNKHCVFDICVEIVQKRCVV